MTEAFFRRIALSPRTRPADVASVILICVVLGLGLRFVLSPVLGTLPGYVLLVPAVVLAGLWAGLGAALLTSLISAVGSGLVVLQVSGTTPFELRPTLIDGVTYLLVAVIMSVVAATLRSALRRSEADLDALRLSRAMVDDSEARFRDIADVAPAMLWTVDRARRLYVNKEFKAFWGDRPLTLQAGPWLEAVHPDDRQRISDASLDAFNRQSDVTIEGRYLRADGTWRTLQTRASARFDAAGQFVGMIGANTDVTDIRAAEARYRNGEARFRNAVKAVSGVLWTNTPDGRMDGDQPEWAALTGQTPEEYSDYGWASAVHPDDALPTVEAWNAAVAARTTFDFEHRLITRDGTYRMFAVRAVPTLDFTGPDPAGEIVEWVGVHIDVTEQRKTAAALRESEARFRDIADTAPVLIWVTREDRQRAFVNQAYVAYMGGDYETVRTADWRDFIHPDDQARLLSESLAGEATGRPFSMEARYKNADGDYRSLKSFSRPRMGPGGAVLGFVGVAFDVTDIREAQALLVESEIRFRTVADSAPALIWMTDDQPQIVFTNKRYKTFFNVEADAIMGERWMGFLHPDDIAPFTLAFMRAFRARDRFEAVMRIQHPGMGQRWLRSEGVPRFDADGVFQGYVGASLDITDAKRAEDDLKRINELLEERVGEALAEKAKAEADLMHAQRMEAVGRLTGGVAHDFNNLLTVVIGALDLILKSPDNAARRKKLGEAALAAARRGEGLTHQLLAFSRRQALRPQPVDLNALIQESEPLLRRAVGETVDYRTKLRRGGARVSVDPAQFEAALLNLMVNARDAVGTRAKGRITVQTQACEVEVGDVIDLPAGSYVCIVVSDNGAGMEAATMTRVFEPFFTTKAVGKGTGLGLSQVYGFARQSGGGVHITSTVGRGTEIRLYLPPLDPSEALSAPQATAATTPLPTGRRILLVEDDAGVAGVAMEQLAGLGLEVEMAETGPDALNRLSEASFDVMLSDIVMPGGMTGIELARLCAQRYPKMQILLTSGYAGDDVDEALADAPWPFLRKPYSGDQLREALSGLLPLAD